MYKIGDLIVYEGAGCICRVENIAEFDFQGPENKKLYYVLKPLNRDCVIYNPVDNESVYTRPVISRTEAERLIDMIPDMKKLDVNTDISGFQEARQIASHYESIIRTHDCETLMKLAMSIYDKKQMLAKKDKNIGSVETSTLRRAEEMLFDELAVALDIPKQGVQDYIEERIGQNIGDTDTKRPTAIT